MCQGSTAFFPHRSAFFSRPGCLGLNIKNRVKSGFFEVINSSATSVFNNTKITFYYSACIACAHQLLLYCVMSSFPHASARFLTCIAVKRKRKTQINERKRGCIHCGSIEYTLDGANAFTVLWWNTSFLRHFVQHTHEWRHHDYYNEELQWLPSTSMYRMHEGVGGCKGPRVI